MWSRSGIGALVPADVRLLSVDELECDEAVLTGESMPVAKSVAAARSGRAPDQPGKCASWARSSTRDRRSASSCETGPRTAFGQIAAGLSEQQGQTAFEVGLARFSRFLFVVAAVLTAFIFVVNIVLSRPLIEALLFSLAIAVGIAPEMMPAIVTVSLSSGSRALAAQEGAGEAAGGDRGPRQHRDPVHGQDRHLDRRRHHLRARPRRRRTAAIGRCCWVWSATRRRWPTRVRSAATPSTRPCGRAPGGHATWPRRVRRVPSESQCCPSTTSVSCARCWSATPTGQPLVITKGAPEVVLDRCVDVPDAARSTSTRSSRRAPGWSRVASRPADGDRRAHRPTRRDLTLDGFLTFADRPKADAGASIAKLRALGVEVKIITGDNGLVAAKVCSEIGLACAGVLNGAEVEALSDDELAAAIPTTTVFARIGPDQKSRIIKVARRTGKDVAFLGDGVNDAVALHHADVGISVDSGTDVAKDAADVVLLDKDLGVLAERRHGGPADLRQHHEVRPDGDVVELRQHVQRRRRLGVPDVPADAAVADPAQQPALQRRPAGDPHRPRRPRGAGAPGRMGHDVHPALHGRLRSDQLDLRLPHLLGDALRAARRPRRVPHRLVRRVDRHPDPGRLRDPHPAGPVLPEPAEPADAARADRCGTGRRRAALHRARATCSASPRCRRSSSSSSSAWSSSTWSSSSSPRPASTAPLMPAVPASPPRPPSGWSGASGAGPRASSSSRSGRSGVQGGFDRRRQTRRTSTVRPAGIDRKPTSSTVDGRPGAPSATDLEQFAGPGPCGSSAATQAEYVAGSTADRPLTELATGAMLP